MPKTPTPFAPITRQQWIYDQLQQDPALGYSDCWPKYNLHWPNKKSTFTTDWKAAKARHSDYQSKANEAKEAVSIAGEIEGLKAGIKTKQERVLILQKEIDTCLKELEAGFTIEWLVINSIYTKQERELSVSEKVALRKVVRELQAEISKIENDYAPKNVKIQSEKIDPVRNTLLFEIAQKITSNADLPAVSE